jgi:8-oxo-dGTP pyrophosphatase MutT (NUDIX family)
MDQGEQPEDTITRELQEELGFETEVVEILDAHLYTVKVSLDESRGVLVVTYLCKLNKKIGGFELNGEAGSAEFKQFGLNEIDNLNMPNFYKLAIQKAYTN